MKRILTTMMIVAVLPLCACDEDPTAPERTVIPGSLVLTSQSDVDLCAGIVEVLGNVTVDTNQSEGDPIRSLAPLSGLEAVRGDFFIRDNIALDDLTELGSLTIVGGILELQDDACLDFTGALPALETVRDLSLRGFVWTEALAGFFASFRITDELYMRGITGMVDLSWLGPQPSLRNIDLNNMPGLDSLQGLENLDSLVWLELDDLPDLIDLGDLPDLTNCERIYFNGCPLLVSLDGLGDTPSLTYLTISRCGALTDLGGLTYAPNLGDLNLNWLDSLESLEGLPELPGLSYVSMHSNASLSRIDLPPNGGEIHSFRSSDNPSLTAITNVVVVDGAEVTLEWIPLLEDLDVTGGSLNSLILNDCPALESVPSLALEDYMWRFQVMGCDGLTSLPDHDNIIDVSSLIITDNPLLDQCEWESWAATVCTYPQVHDNGPCTTR